MATPSSRLDMSVVICSYDEKRLPELTEAVLSVQAQSRLPKEIILVIDHNLTLYQKALKRFEDVQVIENQGEKGASGSRNCGVAASSGKRIAFLDDDAVAYPDWLEQLDEAYRQENVLGVGGDIQPLWLSKRPRWYPEEFFWVIGAKYKGMPVSVTPIRNLWTGNMSVRRDVFDAVEGFRVGFGKHGNRSSPEDTDFCIRILQHFPAGVLLYKPAARVQHRVDAYRASWKFYIRRCLNEGEGKANLSRLVGLGRGTSSEVTHMLLKIPRGVLFELFSSIVHHDLYGFARATAIVAGLSAVVFGFIKGAASAYWSSSSRERAYGDAVPVNGKG